MSDCLPVAWRSVESITDSIGVLFGLHATFDRSIPFPDDGSEKEKKEAVDKLVGSIKSHNHWAKISADAQQRLRVVIPAKKFKPLVPRFLLMDVSPPHLHAQCR